jgi:pre-mRNA-splicing factor SYF1
MSEIVSYPALLEHEESLTKQSSLMYDVSSWMLYLSQVDELLENFQESLREYHSKDYKREKGVYSVAAAMQKHISIGGRDDIKVQDLPSSYASLLKARNLISERALSLLPGSYKLWRDYLEFRSSHVFLQQEQLINNHDSMDYHSYQIISTSQKRYRAAISAYERSLIRMNKYPRIWLMYIGFLVHNDVSCNITSVRRLFNRALLALPATQHDLIWSEYLCYVLQEVPPKELMIQKSGTSNNIGPLVQSCKQGTLQTVNYPIKIPDEVILRVLRRYTHYYNPAARELLANIALKCERFGEAAALYCEILNDNDFLSVEGTTRHELWMKFTDVCTEHPEESSDAGVDFENIIRGVLKPLEETKELAWQVFDYTKTNEEENDFPESVEEKQKKIKDQQAQLQASLGEMEGTLWTKLAHYHIRRGEFELARSIYEEAMESVTRVRDFSLIFDAYVKFEEGVIEAMMEMMNDEEDESNDEINTEANEMQLEDDPDMNILLGETKKSDDTDQEDNFNADIELAMARAENLMSRRPLLLNHVLLQQNPHNVGEWLKRSDIFEKMQQPIQAIASLEEAVKIVNSKQAMNGSPSDLYKALASFHEDKCKDISSARAVYKRICNPAPEYNFRDPDDLAQCYTSWIEMELRYENWDDALSIARRSIAHVPANISNKVTRALSRSLRLWNLLLDLEESLGTLQTTKDAYNKLIESKVATPSHILNFATYLSEKKYFEESFSAYERGLDMFPFPHPGCKILWKEYLQSFRLRYEGGKIHRMRELFERCIDSCPPEFSSEFFVMYGMFEEQYGLSKRALGVYERMCITVPPEEKFTAYQLYITKSIKYMGITSTRPIYERAISALEDKFASKMCNEYAKMESSLQEIERARAVYTYGAQLADPRLDPEYWGQWHEFEVAHGNEETFREMLRVKRGVQAAFSTVNYNAADMGSEDHLGARPLTDDEALAMLAAEEGEEPLPKANVSGFVQAKRPAEMKDLDEVERRAAKLRKVTAGLVAASQDKQLDKGYEDEIDIDDDED